MQISWVFLRLVECPSLTLSLSPLSPPLLPTPSPLFLLFPCFSCVYTWFCMWVAMHAEAWGWCQESFFSWRLGFLIKPRAHWYGLPCCQRALRNPLFLPSVQFQVGDCANLTSTWLLGIRTPACSCTANISITVPSPLPPDSGFFFLRIASQMPAGGSTVQEGGWEWCFCSFTDPQQEMISLEEWFL